MLPMEGICIPSLCCQPEPPWGSPTTLFWDCFRFVVVLKAVRVLSYSPPKQKSHPFFPQKVTLN